LRQSIRTVAQDAPGDDRDSDDDDPDELFHAGVDRTGNTTLDVVQVGTIGRPRDGIYKPGRSP
jgi:hypothetical protein